MQLSLSIGVAHGLAVEPPFVALYEASEQDMYTYKYKLDELLSNLHINTIILHCNNRFCDQHKNELSTMYTFVINACVTTSAHRPNTCSPSNKMIPA